MIIELDESFVNFKEDEENKYNDFAVGKSYFVINEVEVKQSPKAGNYIVLLLSISNDSNQKIDIKKNIFLNPKSKWMFNAFCKSIGENVFMSAQSIDTDAFVGLEGEAISCINNNGYLDIKRFLPKSHAIEQTNVGARNNSASINDKIQKQDDLKDDDLPF